MNENNFILNQKAFAIIIYSDVAPSRSRRDENGRKANLTRPDTITLIALSKRKKIYF